MAVSEADCRDITAAASAANVIFGVCHVLRYTPTNRKIHQLLRSGLIGDIVNIQHTEVSTTLRFVGGCSFRCQRYCVYSRSDSIILLIRMFVGIGVMKPHPHSPF